MRCCRRILGITYKDRVTNIQVVEKVRTAAGPFVELLRVVKKRKLKWFGVWTCYKRHWLVKDHPARDSARQEGKG